MTESTGMLRRGTLKQADLFLGEIRMTKTQTTEKLLTARAVGEMLSLSKRQIFRLNSCGKIPAPIRIGGSVRWRRSDIEQWLKIVNIKQ